MKRKTKGIVAVILVVAAVLSIVSVFGNLFSLEGQLKDPEEKDKEIVVSSLYSHESDNFVVQYLNDTNNKRYQLLCGFEGLEANKTYRVSWKCDRKIFDDVNIKPMTSSNGEYAFVYYYNVSNPTTFYSSSTPLLSSFYRVHNDFDFYFKTDENGCFAFSFWQLADTVNADVRHACRMLVLQNIEVYLYG